MDHHLIIIFDKMKEFCFAFQLFQSFYEKRKEQTRELLWRTKRKRKISFSPFIIVKCYHKKTKKNVSSQKFFEFMVSFSFENFIQNVQCKQQL